LKPLLIWLIKRLGDGNKNGEAANVKQLDEVETNVTTYVNNEIGKINTNVNNNHASFLALYN